MPGETQMFSVPSNGEWQRGHFGIDLLGQFFEHGGVRLKAGQPIAALGKHRFINGITINGAGADIDNVNFGDILEYISEIKH
jgi:hypothetical protein